MEPRKRVVIGLVGSVLDSGFHNERWNKWRPTVSLARHPDLRVDQFILLHAPEHEPIAGVVAADLRRCSTSTEVSVHPLPCADPWDFEEVYGALHDFVAGLAFRPEREDWLVHITTGTHVQQICLFLLTESRHIPGRLIQSSPAVPRRPGPDGKFAIIDLDLSKYDNLARRFARERREATTVLKSGIPTRNPQFNRLIDRLEHVAAHSKEPILLLGPTGAGKTQLARRLYEMKRARHQISGAFVEMNCATLRGESAMSALFGHIRGAFTGAAKDRPGLLRAADGGLLFLDEVGDLGLDEQAMLLRALEEKRFLPLGADREASSDFQLVAGTNRDLARRVREGAFRDDLLARLNLWTFRLPGLRERPEDIEPNLDYELDRLATRNGVRVTFNREARERFLAFAAGSEGLWPANFREFAGALTRMTTLAAGGRITEAMVEEETRALRTAWCHGADAEATEGPGCLDQILPEPQRAALDLFDRVQLELVVRTVRESPTAAEAGRRLFAVSRRRRKTPNDADRLLKYLARFGLTWRACRHGLEGAPGPAR